MPETDPDFWPRTLTHVIAHQALTTEDAAEAMRVIMSGEASPGQIGGFLMALRTKGETVDELEGLSQTALGFANPVVAATPVVDTCGTGGDRSGTFNISTIAAIVVAGAGVPVAKHGNRAASSHCGSADVLESLGVKIDLDAEGVQRCLAEAGIGFMFAPMFHPAAAHAGPVRGELRVPTVFNFLGPLTNPAHPFAQVVGVSDERMLPLMAEVLARRGVRAKVFRGEDGLDELTTTGISTVFDVRGGDVREGHLDPSTLGLARAGLDDLRGGDAAEGAAIARSLLAGETGPRRDVVLLNAAAALEVAGTASDLAGGIRIAADAIDSGAATRTLERWLVVSNA
jgi:anthranilate phosphoribosyltransferase